MHKVQDGFNSFYDSREWQAPPIPLTDGYHLKTVNRRLNLFILKKITLTINLYTFWQIALRLFLDLNIILKAKFHKLILINKSPQISPSISFN